MSNYNRLLERIKSFHHKTLYKFKGTQDVFEKKAYTLISKDLSHYKLNFYACLKDSWCPITGNLQYIGSHAFHFYFGTCTNINNILIQPYR